MISAIKENGVKEQLSVSVYNSYMNRPQDDSNQEPKDD